MYEELFGLSNRPFPSVPDIRRYYPATTSEASRITIDRCLRRGEGAALLIGPSGAGKTLIFRRLAADLRDAFQVVSLASGRLGGPRELLQAIVHRLGLPYRGMDEGELRLELHAWLTDRDSSPRDVALLIDEAEGLKLRTLEEIRMLTNIDDGALPRVRVALAGSALLEEHLTVPKLDSLQQRIVVRAYLETFERDETVAYIQRQFEFAGAKTSPMSEPARVAVHHATGGVPRLINQLCDHTMLLAGAADCATIDASLVEEAWADLQQLPSPSKRNPWMPPSSESTPAQAEGSVVEFGSLDDMDGPPMDAVVETVEASRPIEPVIERPAFDVGLFDDEDDAIDSTSSMPGPVMDDTLDMPEIEATVDPFDEEFEEEEDVPNAATTEVGLPIVVTSEWAMYDNDLAPSIEQDETLVHEPTPRIDVAAPSPVPAVSDEAPLVAQLPPGGWDEVERNSAAASTPDPLEQDVADFRAAVAKVVEAETAPADEIEMARSVEAMEIDEDEPVAECETFEAPVSPWYDATATTAAPSRDHTTFDDISTYEMVSASREADETAYVEEIVEQAEAAPSNEIDSSDVRDEEHDDRDPAAPFIVRPRQFQRFFSDLKKTS